MTFQPLVFFFFLLSLFTACALAAPPPADLDHAASARHLTESSSSDDGHTTPSSASLAYIRGSARESELIFNCKGCGVDYADVALVRDNSCDNNGARLTFDRKDLSISLVHVELSPGHCAADFVINGNSFHLSSRTRLQRAALYLLPDSSDLGLRASISCADPSESATAGAPVIDVRLQVQGQDRPARFEILARADGTLESVSVYADTGANKSLVESKTSVVKFKQQAACAARNTKQCISSGVTGLLQHFKSTIGPDRVAHYSERVQAVMGAHNGDDECNEKMDDYASGVSVDTVSEASTHQDIETVKVQDAPKGLIIALGVLAAALGVAGLLACLKRRCASLRHRVERLADREERIKAREYRCAARQERRRRFWIKVRTALTSCFTGVNDTDEEKAALVLNAAEEGRSDDDLEEAEAHMRGLCYAHDLATQLAATGHFGDLGLDSDRSPAQHTIQHRLQCIFDRYAPRYSRSRASSLPSYDSAILPEYSSQPDMEQVFESARIIDGFRPSVKRGNTGASSRCTPHSSIPSISGRPSLETLGTQLS